MLEHVALSNECAPQRGGTGRVEDYYWANQHSLMPYGTLSAGLYLPEKRDDPMNLDNLFLIGLRCGSVWSKRRILPIIFEHHVPSERFALLSDMPGLSDT
jgi:hypothetical protein